MGYGELTYRAEAARVSSDGKHIRIVQEPTGPYADLRGDARHVERMTEKQARELRDSLNEVLDS